MTMRVLSIASEAYPLIKTGGLADVVGALPGVMAPLGVDVMTLLPLYPEVRARVKGLRQIERWQDFFGGDACLFSAEGGLRGGEDVFVLDAPHLYDRRGNPYYDADYQDWLDNATRFAALAYAGAKIGLGAIDWQPDILHAHDWQAGLVPAYMHYDENARGFHVPTVFTVHNMAFQGWYSADYLRMVRLPPSSFTVEGVEYFGGIGFLKSGLQLSDRVTTVSPTYAREVCYSQAGMGLEGVLRHRGEHFSGILNGLDTRIWDPSNDRLLPQPYCADNLREGKAVNKQALQEDLGLVRKSDSLVFGIVSRLSEQKGLDLVLAAMAQICAMGAQLVVLGTGDKRLEDGFRAAAKAFSGQVACIMGYDEPIAHRIQAGADALLVPSRFEPCGLTQLAALRYGTLPVVSRVGGLSDTVIDANDAALAAGVATGFQFFPAELPSFLSCLQRVGRCWRDSDIWHKMQLNAMHADVSWNRPAEHYRRLYAELLQES